MKKLNALALVVAAAFAVGTVQAENVTGPYLFAGLGLSHLSDDLDRLMESDLNKESESMSSARNKFGFKVGAGYDFNEYIGVAAGVYYLGKATWSFSGSHYEVDGSNPGDYDTYPAYESDASLRTQGFGVTANIGYPITDWFKPYIKLGVGWFHNKATYYGYVNLDSEEYADDEDSEVSSESDSRLAPIAGVGFQFNLSSNFALTAEYERIFNAGKFALHKVDYDLVTIGFKYNFGCAAPAPVAPVTTTERVTETHTLDAGILFPFDGSVLSSEGKQAVSDIIAGSADIDNAAYSVYGFTDRLGSDAYNQALSEKRANAVADELTADGVSNIVNVQGFGKSNPVTGDQCDSVKGRKALIDCLQPDRRVEVQVVGDRTVVK